MNKQGAAAIEGSANDSDGLGFDHSSSRTPSSTYARVLDKSDLQMTTPPAIGLQRVDDNTETKRTQAQQVADELAEIDNYLLPPRGSMLVPPSSEPSGSSVSEKWKRMSSRRRTTVVVCCSITCLLLGGTIITISALADALNKARAASSPECLTPAGIVLDTLCKAAGYWPDGNGTGPVIGDVDFYTANAAWANATAQMLRLMTYAQLLIPAPVNTTLCSADPDGCQQWTLFRVTITGDRVHSLYSIPEHVPGMPEETEELMKYREETEEFLVTYRSWLKAMTGIPAEDRVWQHPDPMATSNAARVQLTSIHPMLDRLKRENIIQRFWHQSTRLVLVGPSFATWSMPNPQRFVYNRLALGKFNTRAYQTMSTIGAFRILDIGSPDDPSYLGNNRVISTWAFRFPGSSSGYTDQHSQYSDIKSFTVANSVYVAVAVERLQPLKWTLPALHHNLGVYIIDATNELNLQVVSRIYEQSLWLDAHSITVYQPAVSTSLVYGRTLLGAVVRSTATDALSLPVPDCRFYDVSVVSRPISLGSWSYTQAVQYAEDPDSKGYAQMSYEPENYRYAAESMAISEDIVVIAYWNFGVQVLRITQYSTWTSLPTQFQLQQIAYYDDECILKPWNDPLSQPVFSVAVSVPLGSVYIADSWPACSGGVIKQLSLPSSSGTVQLMKLQATVGGAGDTVSSLDIFTPGAPADSRLWTPAQLHSTTLVVGRRRGGFQILNATSIVLGGMPATIASDSDHSGSEFEYIGVMNAVAFADAEETATTAFVAYSDRTLGFGIASVRNWKSTP